MAKHRPPRIIQISSLRYIWQSRTARIERGTTPSTVEREGDASGARVPTDVSQSGPDYKLSITDHGPGASETRRAREIERFFQTRHTHTHARRGISETNSGYTRERKREGEVFFFPGASSWNRIEPSRGKPELRQRD